MKIKFLHTGDFHLDCPIKSFENSELRRIELLETISRIFSFVKTNEIDILLLAGDLFDNEFVRPETIRFLITKINEIKDTKVYISPGNHDYIGRNSIYIDTNWPSNVHIFKEFSKVSYNDKLDIYGGGFFTRNSSTSLIDRDIYNAIDKNKNNFLLIHGELSKSSSYNPISIEEIENFDYIALGHTHNYFNIDNAYYPGAPYGRSFNETGEHGFILGTLDLDGELENNIDIEFIKLPGRCYVEIHENLDDFQGDIIDNTTIINDILDKIENINKKDIIKIKLIGTLKNSNILNVDYIKNQLFLYNNLTIDTSGLNTFDIKDYNDTNTLMGKFIDSLSQNRIMDILINSEEDETINNYKNKNTLSLNGENNFSSFFSNNILKDEENLNNELSHIESSDESLGQKDLTFEETVENEVLGIRNRALKFGVNALLGNRL